MVLRNMNGYRKHQRGFTIVEILVSIAISAVILAGVVQVFLGSRQADNLSNSLARIQENGRFSIDILNAEMRLVGFKGCQDAVAEALKEDKIFALNFPVIDYNSEVINGAVAEPGGDVVLLGGRVTIPNALPASHAISLMYVSPTALRLSESMGATDDPLVVEDNIVNFQSGDVLIASRCGAGNNDNIFRVSTATDPGTTPGVFTHTVNDGEGNPSNRSADLGTTFNEGDQLRRVVFNSYFIRTNPRGIPALFRRTINGQIEELIEGVENMRVNFGVCDTGAPAVGDEQLQWLTADQVGDDLWRNVSSVKLAILVRDEANILPENGPATYKMLGEDVAPLAADRRARRVLNTTIKVRNRDCSRAT